MGAGVQSMDTVQGGAGCTEGPCASAWDRTLKRMAPPLAWVMEVIEMG